MPKMATQIYNLGFTWNSLGLDKTELCSSIAHTTALILRSLTLQMIQGHLKIFLIAEGLSLRYRQ